MYEIFLIFRCFIFQACKDTQTDPDFCVVARVEAFIAGWGLDEALKRAEAYRNAGNCIIHCIFGEKLWLGI